MSSQLKVSRFIPPQHRAFIPVNEKVQSPAKSTDLTSNYFVCRTSKPAPQNPRIYCACRVPNQTELKDQRLPEKNSPFQSNSYNELTQWRTWKVHLRSRYDTPVEISPQRTEQHYCLKIKIHDSHHLHTCDWFSSLRRSGEEMVSPPFSELRLSVMKTRGGRKEAWRHGEGKKKGG